MSKPAPRQLRALRRASALAVTTAALTAALAGCSNKGPTVNPVPDCDGTHLLVMTSGRNLPAGQHDIFLYDLDAGGFRGMLGFGGAGQDARAAITLDGKVIAVERTRTGTGQDVLVYDRCAGAFLDRPELVTPGDETDPAFSGDTKRLVFVRDSLGIRRIRLYDGLSRRFLALPLLDSLSKDGTIVPAAPTLDLTGDLIAFVSGAAPTRQILLYSRPGDSLFTTLDAEVNSPNDQRDPWLTPDFRFLAFASDRPGGQGLYDIYMYDLQGHAWAATDSLNSAGNDCYPSLSSDGSFMTFQSDRTTGAYVKGKWDIYNYSRTAKVVAQSFQESSTEDDVEPYLAWP